MKRVRSIIAGILCILMALSFMPLTAFAADVPTDASGRFLNVEWKYTAATDTVYINRADYDGDGDYFLTEGLVDNLPLYQDFDPITGEIIEPFKGSYSKLIIGNNIEYFNVSVHTQYSEPSKLTEIVFEENSSCVYIGNDTFTDTYIDTIELPDSVTKIDSHAFEYSKIKDITIGKNVTDMGIMLFSDCSELVHASIHASTDTLSAGTFERCTKLESVTLDSSKIRNIEADAFYECENLKTISGIENATLLGVNAFYNCSGDSLFFNNDVT